MSSLRRLSAEIIRLAGEQGKTVGVAESLTGGWIASSLAGVPGASRVLMGGIVSYDPRIKRELLGVSQEIIDGVGVVSLPCAKQMAAGARETLGVDIAVSATGLAGPGGGTAETPVGTVYLGLAAGGEPQAIGKRFQGGRQAVRRKAVKAALHMILQELQSFSS